MKQAITFSDFIKTPLDRKAQSKRIKGSLVKDYRRQFWTDLLKESYNNIVLHLGALKSRGISFKHSPRMMNAGFLLRYKPTWKDVIIALLLGLLLAPHVGAQTEPTVQVAPHTIKTVSKLKQPSVAVQSEVASIPVTAPVVSPTTVTGGCQTYWSGDLYLDNIIRFESGGNSCATNPGGCFGLLQACPGEPLRIACGGNPSCQIQWFIDNKTGGRSWAQVWQHELDFGWW